MQDPFEQSPEEKCTTGRLPPYFRSTDINSVQIQVRENNKAVYTALTEMRGVPYYCTDRQCSIKKMNPTTTQ